MKRLIAYSVVLVVVILTTAAVVVQWWGERNHHVFFKRYYWEHGRCYGVYVTSGAVTRSKVPTPDKYCPRVDWNHPPPDMTWKAIADCSFASCPPNSLFSNSIRHLISKIGGGPTREEACKNAEFYLKDVLVTAGCIVKECRCFKAENMATHKEPDSSQP